MSADETKKGPEPAAGAGTAYIAALLTLSPGIGTAGLWLRSGPAEVGSLLIAAFPFAAGLLPLAARTRDRAVLARGLATGFIAAYAVLHASSVGFLFVPAAVTMGVAAMRAFLER